MSADKRLTEYDLTITERGTIMSGRVDGAPVGPVAAACHVFASRMAEAERDADFITSERDAENLRALRAEAEASVLRERLARVEALLAAEYGSEGWGILRDGVRYIEAPRLRAALADTPDRSAATR